MKTEPINSFSVSSFSRSSPPSQWLHDICFLSSATCLYRWKGHRRRLPNYVKRLPTNTITMSVPVLSRRHFSAAALCILLNASIESCGAQTEAPTPRRTVFDEERDRNNEMLRAAQRKKDEALRAAFDAIDKALSQLDDVKKFVEDDDWDGIRKFTRLFNDAVEREGMEKTARKLANRDIRKEALNICKNVTEQLRQIDRNAAKHDANAVSAGVDKVKDLIGGFRKFRPEL